ncbi:MAG: toll/interleukin-1 receptor domain-containing protein [Pseudomonadota bacterium]
MRYAGFISYSHADSNFAAWLQTRLEHFRVPKGVGERGSIGRIFRDQSDLSAASHLEAILSEQLDQSAYLIVVCSPHAPTSNWVAREIEHFKTLGRADKILTVLADAAPGRELATLPAALRDIEPLMVDARKRADRNHAVRMLAAGLLDVDLDTLVRRHSRSQTRRMTAWFAGITLLSICGTTLATYALVQNEELIAEQARRAAAQQTAEETNEFLASMLIASNDPTLSTASSSELLASVLERARQQMGGSQALQDRLIGRIWNLYVRLGWYTRASQTIEEALNESLAAGADPARVAQYRLQLAHLTLLQGDATRAKAGYLNGFETIRGLGHQDLEIEYAMGLAHTHYNLSDLQASRTWFEQARSRLERRVPPNRRALATLYSMLGSLDHLEGELAAADQHFLKTIELADEEAEILTAAWANRGELYDDFGKFDESYQFYQTAMDHATRHYGTKHPKLGKLMLEMSNAIQTLHGWDAAIDNALAAVDVLQETVGEVHPDTARALDAAGLKFMQVGRFDEALAYCQRALQAYQQLFDGDHREIARVHNNVGGILLQRGQIAAAEPYFRTALNMREALFQNLNNAPVSNSRANLADVLNRLGRPTEAAPLARSSARGYRTIYDNVSHWRVAVSESILGESLLLQGEIGQARPLLERSYALLRDARPESTYLRDAHARLQRLQDRQGDGHDEH